MPAVLLEAGSIINRQEELELASPERRALTSAAIVAAVEDFCAARDAPELLREAAAPQPSARRVNPGPTRQPSAHASDGLAAPEREHADDHKIDHVDAQAGGKGRRVIAEIVIQNAGDPAARRHPGTAAQQQRRHAPIGFADRKQFARRQYIGGNKTAEAEAEQRGDRKQAEFVLRQKNSAMPTVWQADPTSMV